MQHLLPRIFLIALSLAFFIACTPEYECRQDPEAYVQIGFYTENSGGLNDTAVSGFSVSILGSGDSSIVENKNNIKTVGLPLSPFSDQSTFLFTFSIPDTRLVPDTMQVVDTVITILVPDTTFLDDPPGTIDTITFHEHPDTSWADSVYFREEPYTYHLKDTLQFNYERILSMISKECGYTYFFSIQDVTHTRNVLGSFSVVNPSITLSDEEDIKLLF